MSGLALVVYSTSLSLSRLPALGFHQESSVASSCQLLATNMVSRQNYVNNRHRDKTTIHTHLGQFIVLISQICMFLDWGKEASQTQRTSMQTRHRKAVSLHIVFMLLLFSLCIFFFIFHMQENCRDLVWYFIIQINNQIINNTSQLFEINE